MMSRAQGRAQRKAIQRQIAAEDRKKRKAQVVALRQAIRDARAAHRRALAHAVDKCRTARVYARSRVAALRAKAFEDLAHAVGLERQAAKTTCETARGEAAGHKSAAQRARAELRAEAEFRRSMRRIEKSAKERHRELARKRRPSERRRESDDEVRANIPAELVYLWERVKRKIKAGPRISRTEAFLHYAEENPREVLVALEDKTEATIRELEAKERAARKRLTRRELADLVPF